MKIVPFQIPWDPKGLADLNRRLSATRWNDVVVSDWSYGMERKFLQQLIGYRRDEYDWAKRRSALNRMPHFRATIDGYGLHFLHYGGRDPGAVPLLLMNGWPSSFVEYQHLAVLLSRGEPSFEVVVPTLPGFGFSDRPTRPYQVLNRLFNPLMKLVAKPWQMYFIGLLFGFGFDSATEISLLVLSGAGAASGLPWYAILCLSVLFASGMSIIDTIDGSLMNVAYGLTIVGLFMFAWGIALVTQRLAHPRLNA